LTKNKFIAASFLWNLCLLRAWLPASLKPTKPDVIGRLLANLSAS